MTMDFAECTASREARVQDLTPTGFVIWTVVGRDRWARRVGFGGPSGPCLPRIANSIVQYSTDVGFSSSRAH